MSCNSTLAPLALFLLALSTPAGATPLRDAGTGLTFEPPPGYSASAVPTTGAQSARFALRRPEDQDTGCQIAYAPAPQNAQLTQPQINELTRTPGWQALARARLAPLYDVLEQSVFDQGGILGLKLVGDLRPREGLPARAQVLRSFFAIQETPRGRTTLVCVAEKPSFATRRAEFEALARSIVPPR
ncbi:MAG TPA: hypothetical protein VNZ61_11415 [Roseomonas sp.]|nr:hypothetical protein [Roseomonas sp.]